MKPALLWLALFLPAVAQAQPSPEMTDYVDLATGLRLSHPKEWRREFPAGGPAKLVLGEPRADVFILCSVEQARSTTRISSQAVLDRDLVKGFKTGAWPQQLAGRRHVLQYQVREIGGVPVGAVDWDGEDERNGKPAFARGIKVFRTTPRALWTAECASIALDRELAEAHFTRQLGLISDIISSVRFPR